MYVAVNAWFSDQPATGSGQYLRHLLPALATLAPEARFGAVVPVGKEMHRSAPNVVLHKTSGLEFLTSDSFGSSIADLYKLWFEQVTFPRTAAEQEADVAHVPYFAAPVRPATPTVVTVHDLIPMVLPAYRGSALVRAYTWLVAAGARRAGAIIADSEWSKRDIIAHLKVAPQRVHVIPLAAGPQFRPATPEEIAGVCARHNLPHRYVLYLGGFDRRKNVPALLQAFARLQAGPDLGLVIAGRLPARDTAFTPDPRRIAARLGIEKSVVFPGWIDERDKPALYSGAELFVFPSTYEGFGLPVLEALACGAPVVTSTASSLPEVAGDAAITVDPHDVTALVQAMVAVLGDAGRRQAMREASFVQAGRFSWKWTAEATLRVYQQALTNSSLSSSEPS
ncbi:MAG: glycosyltransferase family 4 protein [Anaerolineae bacterium]